jgi:L-threonylcarbamoyladenylate synthase
VAGANDGTGTGSGPGEEPGLRDGGGIRTRVLPVHPWRPEPEVVEAAAKILRAGGLVAFPTETVYGLGADALNAGAVGRVFAAKDRPADDPVIVHVCAAGAEVDRVAVDVSDEARRLMARFWPGPLTLVLHRSAAVPDVVTAGGETVAVRCPDHPLARALIQAAGTPLGAPSANRFARTSPTSAAHVLDDLEGRIELVLDGGPTPIGVESTVLDMTGDVPTVLRPGGVSLEELTGELGTVRFRPAARPPRGAAAPSPGLQDRHYAPEAPMHLYCGSDAAVRDALADEVRRLRGAGQTAGLLIASEDLAALAPALAEGASVHLGEVGPLGNLEEVARNLFRVMRDVDALRPDLILARDVPEAGLGRAIRDRLRRAAKVVVEV